jgi:GT2 family glycosyltransferase
MITWIVLTRGDRPAQLEAALASIRRQTTPSELLVVVNGLDGEHYRSTDGAAEVILLPENVGVPGGRDVGARRATTDVIAFLDDDAVLTNDNANSIIEQAFVDDPNCGALSFRIEDEHGVTQRRHVPRMGSRGSDVAGPVATFLGGASAMRRQAYEAAGGYWSDLFYSHEELDLAWRLHDAGFTVVYRPEIVVSHPRTPISRHPQGWFLTGRNRVRIARRNLPAIIAGAHVTVWLLIGWWRAHDAPCRVAYRRGWIAGWRGPVARRPIAWRTVLRLTQVGRPPFL